jgi:uncharacterized protein (DUF2237 family)
LGLTATPRCSDRAVKNDEAGTRGWLKIKLPDSQILVHRQCMTPLPSRNVLGGLLKPCSMKPLTGFFRNGHCDTCAEDQGCHTVCVEVTDAFLQSNLAAGNDLITRQPEFDFPGLSPGDRWCLCASRWLEAVEAGDPSPVILASTHERTLELVPLAILQRYATS